jgi:hypothetical protein
MSLGEVVLGRRPPQRARSDLLSGITGARLALESEFGLHVRAAAIVFDQPARAFDGHRDELVASIAETTGTRLAEAEDGFGFRWIAFAGPVLDDLAISIGMVAESFEATGCWEQLVCALFAFEGVSAPSAYWIYSFERGGFHAFVPRGRGRRDTELEGRLHAAVAHDLRLEPDPQRRYPLWEVPLVG